MPVTPAAALFVTRFTAGREAVPLLVVLRAVVDAGAGFAAALAASKPRMVLPRLVLPSAGLGCRWNKGQQHDNEGNSTGVRHFHPAEAAA